jgi:hypothetical protein
VTRGRDIYNLIPHFRIVKWKLSSIPEDLKQPSHILSRLSFDLPHRVIAPVPNFRTPSQTHDQLTYWWREYTVINKTHARDIDRLTGRESSIFVFIPRLGILSTLSPGQCCTPSSLVHCPAGSIVFRDVSVFSLLVDPSHTVIRFCAFEAVRLWQGGRIARDQGAGHLMVENLLCIWIQRDPWLCLNFCFRKLCSSRARSVSGASFTNP